MIDNSQYIIIFIIIAFIIAFLIVLMHITLLVNNENFCDYYGRRKGEDVEEMYRRLNYNNHMKDQYELF